MNKLFSLFILLVFISNSFSQTNDLDTNQLKTFIEAARKQYNVPGLAVAITYKDKIFFQKGFGVLNVNQTEPVNEFSQFGIASNTKAFTAMAIAMLVKDGKLKFEDKVVEYLPWFAAYNDYVSKEMTIRDLLTHRSGLKTFSGDLIWYATDHSREEIVRRSQYLKPAFGFREKFGYSNIHFLAAGLVIEKVSGMTYDAFLKQRIFKALDMKNTNTSIKNNPKKNVASPHAQRDGKNIAIPYVDWDNIAPAGSINSSVNEMCLWIQTLLREGKYGEKYEIINANAFSKLLQPVTATPVSKFSSSMYPSKHLAAYGMGFNLFDYHGSLVVNHSGGLDGMISHVAFVPEKEFGLVILCNAGSGLPGILLYDILDFMMKEKYEDHTGKYHEIIAKAEEQEKAERDKLWKDVKTGAKAPLDNEAYIGTYTGKVYGSVTVEEKKGQLIFKMDHTKMFYADLHYWKDNKFFFDFKEAPSLPRGTVEFIINKDNKLVTEMIIDCPNPDFDFTELDLIRERK
jgi:CubicO group peptidase (beta-lactamase class C family)